MSSSTKDARALVMYYMREGFYQHAVDECVEMSRKGVDSFQAFWKACGMGFGGGVSDAIRMLQALQSKKETEFPAMVALLHFHMQSSIIDRESIEALDASLPISISGATESSLLLAAGFYNLVKEKRSALVRLIYT